MSLFSKHRYLPALLSLLFLVSSCVTIGTEGKNDTNINEGTQMAFDLTKMAFEMEMNAATTEAMPADEAQPAAQVQAPSIAAATSFGIPQKWSGGTCHKGCYFADVTGDGFADFIAHDNDGINVVPSTGAGFGPQYSNWTGGPVDCHIACYFADATGDGSADFIAHDNDGIWVVPAQ